MYVHNFLLTKLILYIDVKTNLVIHRCFKDPIFKPFKLREQIEMKAKENYMRGQMLILFY